MVEMYAHPAATHGPLRREGAVQAVGAPVAAPPTPLRHQAHHPLGHLQQISPTLLLRPSPRLHSPQLVPWVLPPPLVGQAQPR